MRVAVGLGPLLALAAIALLLPLRVRAQCSAGGSSCVTCHEARGEHPVLDDGRPWHADHAFGDLCVSCHGGDRAQPDAEGAHAGMHDGLEERACAACHDDAHARRAGYEAAPAPAPPPSGGAAGDAARTPTPPAAGPASADRVLLALAGVLGLALAALALRRRGVHVAELLAWLRRPRWSAHAAGALLGVTVAASYALRGRPVGISGAFDALAGYVGRALARDDTYWGQVVTVDVDERFFLVVGVLFGALLSSSFSGTLRRSWLPDRGWRERFGDARATRLVIAFVGALLVQVGAGIAGGCTSGLAVSGGAVLSPAAFVFVAGMFAGGIPVALVVARRIGRSR